MVRNYNPRNNITVVISRDNTGDYVCDGTSDEVQINEAIDAVNAHGGGTVFFKNGTYTIGTSKILMKANVALVGESKAGVIIASSVATPGDIIGAQTSASNCTLKKLTIQGGNPTYGVIGINFQGLEGDYEDIANNYLDSPIVEDVLIKDCGLDSGNLVSHNFKRIKYGNFKNVQIEDSGDDAFHIEWSWSSVFENIFCDSNQSQLGFHIHRGWFNHAKNITVRNAQSDGFQLKGVDTGVESWKTATLDTGGITATATTITLATGTGDDFVTENGYVLIDSEIIYYAERSGDVLSKCSRGCWETTPAIHSVVTDSVKNIHIFEGNVFENCTALFCGRNLDINGSAQDGSGFFLNNWYVYNTTFLNCNAISSGRDGLKLSDDVKYVTVQGGNFSYSNNKGIYLNGGSHHTIRDCKIQNNIGGAIACSDKDYITVENCDVIRNGYYGLRAGDYCTIRNSRFIHNGHDAAGNDQRGIDVGNYLYMENSQVLNSEEKGINGGTYCKIINSTVNNSGDTGIFLDSYAWIEGCIIDSNSDNGIGTGTYSYIQNNRITNNSNWGIDDNSRDQSYTSFDNNIFSGNASGNIRFSQGTFSKIIDENEGVVLPIDSSEFSSTRMNNGTINIYHDDSTDTIKFKLKTATGTVQTFEGFDPENTTFTDTVNIITTSAEKLDLNDTDGGDNQLRFSSSGTEKYGLIHKANADDFGLYSFNESKWIWFYDSSTGNLGIGTNSPNSLLELGLATENLEFADAGSTGATEQDWIEVEVGGVVGYIRVYATK